jgi:two-component system response regulator PilR (NtrC family)
MAKILVLDDDQGMREFMEIMLTKEGYDVTSSESRQKQLICAARPPLIWLSPI